MKRLIIFCLLLMISSADVSAKLKSDKTKSGKPRNWTQLSFLGNGQKYDKSEARVFTTTGLVHWKEMSLKTFDREKLNDIELALLDKYDDVVVTRVFKCYFIFDEVGRIGIADINGNELVPPVLGNIRQWGTFLLVGERSDDFNALKTMPNYNSLNSTYSVAYSMGLCKSVVTFKGNGVFSVIPYGEYDYISPIPTMGYNGVRGFYVYNLDENKKKMWGYYDKKGKEVIPCKYRSITYDGKNFYGNNEKSMDEVMKTYEKIINIERTLRLQRAQMWAEVLNSVGDMMMYVGSSMQQIKENTSTSKEGRGTSVGSGSSSTGTHSGMTKSQLQQRYNAAIQTIRKLRDSWSVGDYSEVSNKNILRDCKKNIQSIKKSASEHGYTLQTDPLEYWEP